MFILDPLALFDGGFGPCMVPVTPPDGDISPVSHPLQPKDMGKAPGIWTPEGWVPRDLRREYFVSREWVPRFLQYSHNIGVRGGLPLGMMWFDNDQGEEFSQIFQEILARHNLVPLRRYVDHSKHKNDAFLLCLVDVAGPVEVVNRQCKFVKGVREGKFQILGQGKHAVACGIHNRTRRPYVWNRNIVTTDDVPCIHITDWAKAYEEFVLEVEGAGWKLESGQRTVSAQAPPPPSGGGGPTGPTGPASFSSGVFTDLMGLRGTWKEVNAALLLLPNDIAQASVALNRFLDLYKNYIDICYMIVGALGATPEARELWLKWAHQRQQFPRDNPEIVWASAARQPVIHLGMKHLVQLVQEFGNSTLWAQFMFSFAPDVPDDPPPDPAKDIAEIVRQRWAYVYKPDCYLNLQTNELVTRASFNSLLAPDVPDLYLAVKGTAIRRRAKTPRASDVFDLMPNRRVARNITYAPGDPTFAPTAAGEADANSWRPSPHGLNPGVTEAQIAPWLDHIEFVLGNRAERDRFLRWCAYQVQFPRGKSNWHWLLMSPEGYGKDTMFKPVRLAVGPDNFIDVSVFDLSREFNHYTQRKMIVVNETRQINTATVSAHDLYTKLKRMLASPPEEITVNLKNRQEFLVPNRHAFFMFSNEKSPLYLAENSRRLHVIDRTKQPVPPVAYFDQLTQTLDGGLSELAAAYLRHYPLPSNIESEMRGVAPSSPTKEKLQAMNREPLRVVLEEIVDDARNGVGIPTLLATASNLIDMVKGRSGLNPHSETVNRHMVDIDGVTPVIPPKDGHVGPGWTSTLYKGQRVGARLWRLGDKTADGHDLTRMTNAELILFHRNGTVPPSATVSPILKEKLAEADDV